MFLLIRFCLCFIKLPDEAKRYLAPLYLHQNFKRQHGETISACGGSQAETAVYFWSEFSERWFPRDSS
jgi:hypothetical protein